eukprot:6491830-Amphidinium_carterae.1
MFYETCLLGHLLAELDHPEMHTATRQNPKGAERHEQYTPTGHPQFLYDNNRGRAAYKQDSHLLESVRNDFAIMHKADKHFQP